MNANSLYSRGRAAVLHAPRITVLVVTALASLVTPGCRRGPTTAEPFCRAIVLGTPAAPVEARARALGYDVFSPKSVPGFVVMSRAYVNRDACAVHVSAGVIVHVKYPAP